MQVKSDANMGLHRSTTCPSSDSNDPILNTLLHTLEYKAKSIAMERADAAILSMELAWTSGGTYTQWSGLLIKGMKIHHLSELTPLKHGENQVVPRM